MLQLGSPFQSGMILQQKMRIPVWGTATPGKRVLIVFAGQALGILADETGKWQGNLSPVDGSFLEYEMIIRSEDEKIVLTHVRVGEVWVCGGQSNMQHSLKETPLFELAKLVSGHVDIAELHVAMTEHHAIQEQVACSWHDSTDHSALAGFTAEGWSFAYEIANRMHVPVGLLNISRGGTVVEAWTPKFIYDADPVKFKHQLDRIAEAQNCKFANGRDEFLAVADTMRHKDVSNDGFPDGWASDPLPQPEKWRPIPVPNFNAVLYGDVNGAFWYRKEIEIPEEWIHDELELHLGVIDDLDTTYFNGVQIGFTGPETKDPWGVKRIYAVPQELVRKGRNLIAVRNFDEQQMGGMMGPELKLVRKGTDDFIDLAGDWLIRAEKLLHQIEYPVSAFSYYKPSSLFNAMLAPLIPYAVRGVLWQHGENNSWNAEEYGTYYPAMIQGWRKAWQRDDLPFISGQLSGCHGRAHVPGESSFATIREAMRRAAQEIPGVYCVPLAGVSEEHEIHFRDKLTVGRRMADVASAGIYGILKPDFAFAPMAIDAVLSGKMVAVSFDYGKNLFFRGDDTTEQIALCGEDGVWYWADAVTAKDGKLFVCSGKVPTPVKVRYAWTDNPKAELCNAFGIRAFPFEISVRPE